MTYVAVGFKVDKSRSIFYIKDPNIEIFIHKLLRRMSTTDPDFVSIRRSREAS